MTTSATALVLTTVNAPYRTAVSAEVLAGCISSVAASSAALGPTFSFFSEVPLTRQLAFIEAMKLDPTKVRGVARHFAGLSGHPLPLAT
ncbi:hypothetical protein [Zavarzinia sp. CC-PAN008]|uniref:hypothetical protein n=1 Tax=Zavarzinia sp. CC-PAN008 TaxID=3243332 RepID=UPI003F747157